MWEIKIKRILVQKNKSPDPEVNASNSFKILSVCDLLVKPSIKHENQHNVNPEVANVGSLFIFNVCSRDLYTRK